MTALPLPSLASPSPRERVRLFLHTISLRSYFVGFMLAIVLGGSYFAFAQGGSQSQTTTADVTLVERRTIVSMIKAVGKVTFASEQQMKFNLKGTVARVNFQEGDSVRKGQVIAELDKTTALADVRQSQLAIGASQLQLEQLQADRDSQILAARNSVNAAQRQVVQAQADLEKTRETELQNLASTAQNTLIASEKLLDSFYSVLTRDAAARPTQTITTFEINRLLFRDWSIKERVDLDFRAAVNKAEDMHRKYGTNFTAERDPHAILEALQDAQSLAETLQRLGEDSYNLMQGATTDATTFTVGALNTLRATVNTNRVTAAGLVDDARAAQANLVDLSQTEEGIPSVTLQDKENTAVTNLESYEAKQADFQSTVNNLDISIRLKQNDIAQKSASLTKLRKTLDDYQLVAPFDGVVTHIDYKVGDNLLDTGDTESLTLQNPGFLLITIPLDQVDVVHVRKNMSAHIVFDAVPGQAFEGMIDQIDSTPIEQSGVVSYDVSVRMPTPDDLNILSGMTATVQIEIAKKENALVVPNLALRSSQGGKTVQTAAGEALAVQTGITDGRYTEILSGVSEGDAILSLNVASTVQSTSTAESTQQLMRNFGRLGGGGSPR